MRTRLHPRLTTSVSVSLCLLAGCARWGSRNVDGPPQELARRAQGAPQVAVTTDSAVEAGFGAATATDGAGGSATAVGLAGSSGSVTRTHCIQQVEIDYTQSYEIHPEVEGREIDVLGGITLGVIGLGVVGVARMRASRASVFDEDDPFYEEPPDPTTGYLVGGALIAGGLAWVLYSNAALPSGPRPAVQPARRDWTETRYVEATGCGLVPADRTGLVPR